MEGEGFPVSQSTHSSHSTTSGRTPATTTQMPTTSQHMDLGSNEDIEKNERSVQDTASGPLTGPPEGGLPAWPVPARLHVCNSHRSPAPGSRCAPKKIASCILRIRVHRCINARVRIVVPPQQVVGDLAMLGWKTALRIRCRDC